MIPPVLVREDAMYGTGFFPSDKSDYYAVPEDGLYLVGTSEVPLIGMHMDEILEELPLYYCAFSSCFRRESGAAGRDTRGMFRVHQFQKVEMVAYTRPEDSWDLHERMLQIEESLVQAAELPYRVVNTAAGDLSTARLVGGQAEVVKGLRRSAADRHRLPLEQPHAYRAGDRPLGAGDSGELPGRRTEGSAGVRRACARRRLARRAADGDVLRHAFPPRLSLGRCKS